VKTQTLYFSDGRSDKQYTLSISQAPGGYNVVAAYGRRGSTLQTQNKTPKPVSLEAAEALFDAILREKIGKGYRPGADAAPVETSRAFPAHVGSEFKGTLGSEYRPMLLNSIDPSEVDRYINDPAWIMQTKEDGVHAVLHVGATEVTALSRTEHTVALTTDQVALLKRHFSNTILDGEVIGDRLVLFDLLAANGTDLRGYPAHDRLRGLTALFDRISYGGPVSLIESASARAEKGAMLKRLHAAGAEGVVFKLAGAPYTAGRPSSAGNALKLKFCASATVKVVSIGKAGKQSAEVALADGRVVASIS